ncbi:MAG: fabD [Actinomycetia bacterium]|nr:fabD [Actinomycetes bacterium]
MRVAVVFPGQGTQAPGMGQPWRDHPSWAVAERAEEAFGEPLTSLVVDAPAEQLARTRDAQLAVLCTSLVAWDAVKDRLGDSGEVVGFAGHSLGQVTALIASGALGHDDGVRFAARRAEATQAAADAAPGRMAALLGATLEQADAVCASAGGECWVANDNAPGQVVIAGTPAGIEQALTATREHGVRRATPLNVGGAFHTPLMRPASDPIDAALADVGWSPPAAPVMSNEDAQAYDDTSGWRERLVRHVTTLVRWRETMENLAALGATHLVEVGHGTMIAGLAKRTIPDVTVINIATPADLENLTAARA